MYKAKEGAAVEAAHFLTIILATTTGLSTIAIAAMAYFVYRTLNQGVRSQGALIFYEVVRRYDAIYVQRNQLLTMDLKWSSFNSKYPSLEEKLNSNEWRTLREVAACFEFIGILVKHKYIDTEVVFDMVLVNPRLWAYVSEIVYSMREAYNPNQWVNWEYLVRREQEYFERRTRYSTTRHP